VTRGPYWIDEFDDPNDDPETGIDANIPERSDVTDDTEGSAGVQAGLPLTLQLTIYSYDSTSNTCTPLSGARVDIWHCNAAGVYSDINAQSNVGQEGRDFLRGYQVTGADGKVAFMTIYPGWYQGRVTHIHLKVRVIDSLADGGVEVPTEATTQLFFADSITAAVYGVAPYASKGQNSIVNADDMVYASMANPTANLVILSGDVESGYTATASLGVALGTRA
jgi:protocatechuate 3,4-dioxygenase beta subunit